MKALRETGGLFLITDYADLHGFLPLKKTRIRNTGYAYFSRNDLQGQESHKRRITTDFRDLHGDGKKVYKYMRIYLLSDLRVKFLTRINPPN
jgi:hypothetical protein